MYNTIKFFGSPKELLGFTGGLSKAETQEREQGITFDVFQPHCAANSTDKFSAEIRKNGWALDEQRFESYAEAVAWAQNHAGKMSRGVAQQYLSMFHRYATK